MRIEEFRSLSSEIAELRELLQEIPEEDVIDRRSILARLEQASSRLPPNDLVEPRERAKAILTFKGRPVVGTHGIRADFGSKATNIFVDAVAAIAASLDAPLKATGPIRDRQDNVLLITGTAVGSFGFELEAGAPTKLTFDGKTNVELALTRAISLLSACERQDDEALADSIEDLDKRALGKIREFVTTLAESEATCALAFERTKFQFSSTQIVQRTVDKLSNNIGSQDILLTGHITGVIPSRRTVEFTTTTGETIVGKIGPDIVEPAILNNFQKVMVRAAFAVTRVGEGKPRYLLKNLLNPALVPGDSVLHLR